MKHSLAAAQKIGHAQTKFHVFWDDEAVKANLADVPESMPKEERRAKTEESRKDLVQQFVRQEPSSWKLPATVKLVDYPEAWANEILPTAREAHERLRFQVHAQEEKYGTLAAGEAEGKETDDTISYEDWAARIVHDELHKAGWRLADLLEKALP